MFLPSLPTLLVCLAAVVVLLLRKRQCGRAFVWALMGFGLVLALSFAVPIVQTAAHQWAMQGADAAQRVPIFAVISFVWSMLRAAAYALLLVAVLAGRPAPDRSSLPSTASASGP